MYRASPRPLSGRAAIEPDLLFPRACFNYLMAPVKATLYSAE